MSDESTQGVGPFWASAAVESIVNAVAVKSILIGDVIVLHSPGMLSGDPGVWRCPAAGAEAGHAAALTRTISNGSAKRIAVTVASRIALALIAGAVALPAHLG